jgi:hypothetical protein
VWFLSLLVRQKVPRLAGESLGAAVTPVFGI